MSTEQQRAPWQTEGAVIDVCGRIVIWCQNVGAARVKAASVVRVGKDEEVDRQGVGASRNIKAAPTSFKDCQAVVVDGERIRTSGEATGCIVFGCIRPIVPCVAVGTSRHRGNRRRHRRRQMWRRRHR
eukprot:6159677-Prymnesium_polylepis.1